MEKKDSLSFLDLLLVLFERKRFIIIWMACISAFAIALALLLPSTYAAKVVILPPSSSQMGLPLGGLMGGMGGGDQAMSSLLRSFNILGSGGGTDQLLSILDSRRLAEIAINKFDLVTHYKFKGKKHYPEDVIKKFHQALKVQENDLDNIELSVEDKDPQLAYEMANFIVDELDSINYLISKEHAGFSRRFFEERLAKIKSDLDSAHGRFANFKVKNNYLDMDKQVKSTLDVLSNMESERMAMDVEIDQIRSKLGGESQRLRELLKERSVLEKKSKSFLNNGDGDVLIALKDTPRLGIEYAYLYRDVKVQEALYQFVLQMFEQAKMNEANNVPTVRILEHAYFPKKRATPKRGVLCILIFFSGLVVISGWVVVQAWIAGQRAQGTDTYHKLKAVKGHLTFRK